MPNVPGTKHRSVRVDDADWADLEAVAKLVGKDRAKILNAFIGWYLRRPGAKLPERPSREQVAEVVARREASQDMPTGRPAE